LTDFVYDNEVYPNVFTMTLWNADNLQKVAFEISERRNDLGRILATVEKLRARGHRMVGFNNYGYDYPVTHELLTELRNIVNATVICEKLYRKSMSIIEAPHDRRFDHIVRDRDQLVPQLDLYKVHHFDNVARATSLKMLEFNMRLPSISDLPFPPGTYLDHNQIDTLLEYNDDDVGATYRFYLHTLKMIRFREELSKKYDRNFLNHNDTKIGKDYFIMRLEQSLGPTICYTKQGGRRQPRQTIRNQIALKDVIFDYIKFNTPQFQAVKHWLELQVIWQTKGVFTETPVEQYAPLVAHMFDEPVAQVSELLALLKLGKKDFRDHVSEENKDALKYFASRTSLILKNKRVANLNVKLDGVQFVFGTGGIHASIENTLVESDDEYVVIDLDVASYYPNLAIANKLYPHHLGPEFCEIYRDLYEQRKGFAKGTVENGMLKLALNGVYGDSNNLFSPFYDPQYTMSITVNGQLLLCMLYEDLRQIEGLTPVQMNTDGLTVRLPREKVEELRGCAAMWELLTGLELEEAEYEFMHIRDCNNYIAKYAGSDKVKRKGAYAWKTASHTGDPEKAEVQWHQNQSAMVVPRAAEAAVVHGSDIREFIESHDDPWDFLLRTKVPRSSKLTADYGLGIECDLQNITRYYIASGGPELVKVMPPLKKKPDQWRRIAVNKGCSIRECNTFDGLLPDIDFDWYVKEAEKLVYFK
jgi:hypothetical protein